jgi:hypothetical protein
MKLKTPCFYLLLFSIFNSPAFSASENETESTELTAAEKRSLERWNEEEESIEAEFDYSPDDVRNQLVIIGHGQGFACGFIAVMDGKSWIFTNQLTLYGTDKVRFTTADGVKLRPRKIELAATRDIARLLVDEEQSGFKTTSNMPMGSPIGVFCSSPDDKSSQGLFGKVNGIGAEIVEVSAHFESENGGSPVLNLDREAIGIASYVRESNAHAMKEGTRFENTTRRFCYRLDGVEWKSVNWKKYNEKYGNFYRENALFIEGIVDVFDHWEDKLTSSVSLSSGSEKSLTSWTSSHNTILDKYRGADQKKRLAAELSKSIQQLADQCGKRSRQTRMILDQSATTEYLDKEFDMQAGSLDYFEETLEYISNNAQDIRY